MNKVISRTDLQEKFKSGSVVMVGGFLGVGTPESIINIILETKVDDLTLICNDTAFETIGVGRLVTNKRISKAIVSHIGTNPETGRQMKKRRSKNLKEMYITINSM